MHRSAVVLVTLLGLILAAILVSPASAAKAEVQPLITDAQLTAAAYAGPTSVDLVLPPQAVPVRLQGQLESTAAGRVLATVGVSERQVLSTAVRETRIDADLTAADVVDGAVRVWLALGADDTAQCDDALIAAVLSEVVIWYSVPTGEPGSVAEYLQGVPATFTVVVDPGADRLTQQGGLNAVTTLASLYPNQTDVMLRPTQPVEPDALNRVMRFEPTQGPGVVALDSGGLVVSGDSATFDEAVFALGGSYRGLLTGPAATDIAGVIAPTNTDTVALSDIGPEVISLSTLGTVQSSVGISQSIFARPTQELTVELNGVITPAAGGTGRVNILWNGQLVDSVEMTENTTFTARAVIDSAQIGRDNTLTLQLQYLPKSGSCAIGELPARLDIDAQSSSVVATPGGNSTGFDMLPQALEDTVAVAVGTGQEPAESTQQLAQLLVGLQRLSDSPLAVAMMDWPVFAETETPGVATGLTPQEADALGTPLRLAPFRTVDVDKQQFSAEVAGDFAALQSYRDGERALLLLGGVGEGSGEAADDIVAMMADDRVGFAAYTGDVMAAQPGGDPFSFEVAVLSSQPEQVASRGPGQLWWLWWALGLLAASLGVGIVVRRRR